MGAINHLVKRTIVILVVFTLLFNASAPVFAVNIQENRKSPENSGLDQPFTAGNEVSVVEGLGTGDSQLLPEFSAEGSSLGSAEEIINTQAPILAEELAKEVPAAGNSIPPEIHLKASPQLVLPDEPITITWWLSDEKQLEEKAEIEFSLQVPLGLTPTSAPGEIQKTDDEETTIYLLKLDEVKENGYKGEIVLEQTGKGQAPYLVSLVIKSGEEVLTSNAILLREGQFFVDSSSKSRSSIESNNVSLDFSSTALDESLYLDIRNPGPSSSPGYSLSGTPVEILAVSEKSKENVTQFENEYTLSIRYDEADIFDWNEGDLSIFYYDEEKKDWHPVQTEVDEKNNTLTAKVDHLTVFDYKAESWQGANLPSVDSFQVSSFTGAATYSVDFWTPPAPGGFQPSISLSYNSQVIDDSTAFTQASWVGMGWSLDTGYIERNMNGSNSYTADDTFSLVLNGISSRVLPVSVTNLEDNQGMESIITRYATEEQSYLKITQTQQINSSGTIISDLWKVIDQSGTEYRFEDVAKTSKTDGCVAADGLDLIWRWSLSTATNVFDQTITYTYAQQKKTSETSCLNVVAVYPETITYPNNRYQIIFQRENRTDYQEAWEDDDSKTFFSNQRLDKILVKQSLDGITWNTVRQYNFIYSGSAANQIYPGFTWTKGGYTSTLVGLQELDGGGTNALPATQFTYEDDLHVTAVNNGQGGEVEMTYERWTYLDDHNDDLRSLYTEFGVDECNWNVGTSWYEMPETNGITSCYDNDNPGPLWVMGHNALGVALHTFPQHTIKPGGRYTLHISVSQRDNGSTGVFWGFTDPLNGKDVEWSTTVFGNTVQGFDGQVDMDVNFDPQETKCIIECDDCLVKKIQIMLMPLYYRVTQRVVTDNVSGDTLTYVYEYDEPAANDPSHSEAVLSDRPFWNSGHSYLYTLPYRQYRGNAVVHVKNPDDLVTTTWFYQNDILKGKAYQSLTYKEEFSENFDSGVLNTVDFNYSHEGTNQTIYIAEEGALKSENLNADWLTHVNRTGYEITNGKVVFGQFKLEDGVDSKTQLVASNGNYVGLESRASGAGQELLLSSQIGEDDLILLSNSEFKQDTWYGFMFVFDGGCGTRVKVWEKANPQVSAEAVSTALNGQTALQFRQSVNHAVLWLDDYHEGYPYSETETRYAVDVLYDTIAGNAVPDISQSTLVSSYDDLQVTWSRVTESISRTFDGDASWTGNKTVYDYNTGDQGGTQYGNLTRTKQYSGEFGTISVIHSGNLTSTTAYSGEYGTWTAYRGTKTQYFPDAANNLTAQPARQISLDCSSGSCDFSTENGLLSETLYLYDGAVSYFSEPANGILTAQRTWVQENNYAQVSYAYDSQGNLTDETVYTQYAGAASNPTGGAQTTHTEYDSINNTYATSVTNPLSQVTSMTYDYALGLPLSVTDANAATTIARYDPFGRMTSVIAPYDSVDSPTLQVIYQNYAGASSPYQVYLVQKVDGRNFIRISHFYDGLGREIQTQQADLPVYGALNNIVTDYDYDAVGNLVRTSIPRQISADTTPSMTGQDFTISSLTTYDVLGRPLSVEAPNKNTTTYAYDDLRTTVTNPRGFSTTSTYDIWGRVVAVDEAEGPDLSYIYDPLDRLLSVTSAGLTTTLTYDHAGRKTGMSDPDMGDWTYTYDALGTLLTQTDARGCQTSLSYDSLNRLTGKTYSGTLSECDNTPDVSYTYDGGTGNIGRRTGMTDGSGSTLWNYDQRGRLTSETKIIDGQSFTTSWTYNSADEVTSITYPDGEIVYNSYTHQGLLTAVSGSETYLKDMHYDAEGRISHIWLGSNVIEKHYTYYPWKNETVGGLLYSMDVQNANSENLLTLNYTYDKNANVTEISSSTAVETSSFTYDALDRLTSMTVNDGLTNVFTEAFGYDAANGNLLYKGQSSSNWAQYAYEGDQPHAVTSLSGTQLEYGYDDNGNMVTRVEADGEERTLIYDAENNLVEVIAQQASPTPTPTEPALLNTDFQSPANTQAEAGGDADGFESSPENAFADDGTYALDTDSGTSSLADCADSGRDGQVYSDYSFGIPAGSAVSGIELRLDAFADDTGGNPQICAQLSWDGGETWTDCKTTAVLTASEASYILGGQEDTWGHTWNTTQLAQGAFKVRLVNIAESDQRDFSLDWAAVKVHYLDGIALNLLDGANLKVLAGAAPLPESLRLQADEGTLTPTPTLTGTASPLPSETPQYTPTPSLTATETIVFTSTPTLTQTIETPLPSETPEVSATPSPVVTEWTPTPTVTISGTPVETAALTPTPTASGTPTQTAVPTATLDPQVTDTGYLAVDAWSVSSNGDGDGYETDPANVYTDDSLFAADMNSGTAASLECADTSRDMGIFTLTGGIDLSAAVLISGIEVRLDALASTDTMNAALCVQLSWDAGTSWSDCRETGALSTSETSYVLGGPQETWGVSQTPGLYNGDPIQVRIVNLASDTDTDFYLDWLAIKVYYLPETSTATSVPLNTPDGLMAIAASLTQINLSWHDNNSDETAFSLERSTDGGGSWQEIVVLDPDTTTYTDTGLTCGRVYDYRLRAYRAGDGLYSDYSAVESSPSGACTVQTDGEFEIHHMMTRTLGEFDDANPAMVYSGAWTNESAAGAYNGTRTYSQNEGSKLTFTAEISCFSLLYTAMAGGADVDVYVDGDLFDTIDQNRSGLDYQEAWGSCGLENDQTHVLVFRQSSGALMDVDALLVKNNPLADDDDPLIHYDLGWSTFQGAGPYDDSIHYSETVGSRAEVTFSGSSVGLVYTKGSNRGVIKVEVDGVTLAYLNEHLTGTMYDAETQFQQSWTYNTLDVGEHILTLTHTSGTLVDIDGIRVAELLPAALEGAEYTYDGDNNLVKSEVNGVVTYYLGKYYEKTVQNGHYAEKKHYSAGSTIIAVRTVVDGTQDTLNWLVGDHLGSTSLVTDSAGAVVSEVRYSAFGEMRYLNGETVTDLLYTGQKLDSYINLYWYSSRWYDSVLGRFIQPDSLVPNPGASWAYDRYSYVGNNPIRYNDPNGHYRMSGGGPPYPNPTPSPGYDPKTVLDPTPAKTPEPINSGNPVVISPVPVPEPWVSSKVAPPGEFDDKGNYLGEPPDVEGLSEDEWEFGNFPNSEPGSFRHPADPGHVWSPHSGKPVGVEGEDPHWHRRVPGTNRRGEVYPPNPGWGRGTNDRSGPGVYNPDTGRYESGISTNYGEAIGETLTVVTILYGVYQVGKWAVVIYYTGGTGIPFLLTTP